MKQIFRSTPPRRKSKWAIGLITATVFSIGITYFYSCEDKLESISKVNTNLHNDESYFNGLFEDERFLELTNNINDYINKDIQ